MTYPRVLTMSLALLLLVSLCGVDGQAQTVPAIQLCGFTQFVDFIIIGAVEQAGSRTLLPSVYIQIVPHLYTVQGGGNILRDPIAQGVFPVGFSPVNPSDQFGNNRLCAVTGNLHIVPADVLLVTGDLLLFCTGNPSGPFQIALQVSLTTCDEPGFLPQGEVNIAARPSARLAEPEGREARGPAGSALNEYGR